MLNHFLQLLYKTPHRSNVIFSKGPTVHLLTESLFCFSDYVFKSCQFIITVNISLFLSNFEHTQQQYEDVTQEIKNSCHNSITVKFYHFFIKKKTMLMVSKSSDLLGIIGTKICSVQLDSCSGHSESWLLPIQLPTHNISRELQPDWAKSEATWRHLWVTDSSGVWSSSHHRCNDSVGGRPGRLITRSKEGSAWSFSPVPTATTWLQLLSPLIERQEGKSISSVREKKKVFINSRVSETSLLMSYVN